MKRRLFFRSLFGSSVVAGAVVAAESIPVAASAHGQESEIIHAAMTRAGQLGIGHSPSGAQYIHAKFHLDAMIQEGFYGSPSILALSLANRLVSIAPPKLPIPPVEWKGDSLDTPLPIEAALRAEYPITHELRQRALDFYNGGQWESNVYADRIANSRPCLTINQLPVIVARAIAAHGGELNDEQIDDFKAFVTIRNRDAQRLYNYMASSAAELMGVHVADSRRRIIVAPA